MSCASDDVAVVTCSRPVVLIRGRSVKGHAAKLVKGMQRDTCFSTYNVL